MCLNYLIKEKSTCNPVININCTTFAMFCGKANREGQLLGGDVRQEETSPMLQKWYSPAPSMLLAQDAVEVMDSEFN